MQKYLHLFSVSVVHQNEFVCTVWLLTNEIFHILAGTLKCKFLTKPDWL